MRSTSTLTLLAISMATASVFATDLTNETTNDPATGWNGQLEPEPHADVDRSSPHGTSYGDDIAVNPDHASLGDKRADQDRDPDLDGDGIVDVNDMLILLEAWGACDDQGCSADLNGDQLVDEADLVILLSR